MGFRKLVTNTSLCVCSVLSTLAFGGSPIHLDFGSSQVLAEFEQYNLASNVFASGGRMAIPDSQRDVLIVRSLTDATSYEVAVSGRPQYVLELPGSVLAVSDPSEDRVLLVDGRRATLDHHFSRSFGPWQLAYHEGILYGSNRFDRLITRYDLVRRQELEPWAAGSGPRALAVIGSTLFVVEEGAAGAPDDHLGRYDLATGAYLESLPMEGVVNDLVPYGEKLCFAVAGDDVLRCGHPDVGFVDIEVAANPYQVVVADQRVWVLSRGYPESGEGQVLTLAIDDSGADQAGYTAELTSHLQNARQMAFDSVTRTFVFRGDRRVIGVPMVSTGVP